MRRQATSQDWKSSERKGEESKERLRDGEGDGRCVLYLKVGASKTRQSQKRRSGEWDGWIYVRMDGWMDGWKEGGVGKHTPGRSEARQGTYRAVLLYELGPVKQQAHSGHVEPAWAGWSCQVTESQERKK